MSSSEKMIETRLFGTQISQINTDNSLPKAEILLIFVQICVYLRSSVYQKYNSELTLIEVPSIKSGVHEMMANVIREKIQEEIHLLAEDQLEDLYRVIHYYRLGAQTDMEKSASLLSKEPQQIIKRVLERMQAYSLKRGTPRLNREQLHERR
jgi:hypothetical protein